MENRYYFYNDEQNDVVSAVGDFFEKKDYGYSNAQFIYLIDEQSLLKKDIASRVSNIIDKLDSLGFDNDFTISFLHESKKAQPNNKFCDILKDLEKQFPKVKIGLENGYHTWNTKEIENANNQISTIVDEINSKKLSTVEKIMCAYFEVTNRQYQDVEQGECSGLSRSTYGVLNTKKSVCVGYSELFKEIVDQLNLSEVKVFLNYNNVCIPNEVYDAHCNIVAYIKDEKYGIDGYYYFDPTWDADRSNNQEFRLNFFMVPLDEIDQMQEYEILSDKIGISGYRQNIESHGGTHTFYYPDKNNKISLFNNGVYATKEFANLICSDNMLRDSIKSKNISQNDITNTNNAQVLKQLLSKRSKNIGFKTMKSIVKNVVKQKFNRDEQSKIYDKIINTNCQENKYFFRPSSNTYFSKNQIEDDQKTL